MARDFSGLQGKTFGFFFALITNPFYFLLEIMLLETNVARLKGVLTFTLNMLGVRILAVVMLLVPIGLAL